MLSCPGVVTRLGEPQSGGAHPSGPWDGSLLRAEHPAPQWPVDQLVAGAALFGGEAGRAPGGGSSPGPGASGPVVPHPPEAWAVSQQTSPAGSEAARQQPTGARTNLVTELCRVTFTAPPREPAQRAGERRGQAAPGEAGPPGLGHVLVLGSPGLPDHHGSCH